VRYGRVFDFPMALYIIQKILDPLFTRTSYHASWADHFFVSQPELFQSDVSRYERLATRPACCDTLYS
jgi:hypothetical protein